MTEHSLYSPQAVHLPSTGHGNSLQLSVLVVSPTQGFLPLATDVHVRVLVRVPVKKRIDYEIIFEYLQGGKSKSISIKNHNSTFEDYSNLTRTGSS